MKTIKTILNELHTVCNNISDLEFGVLVQLLQKNNTFYFTGEGRSGLVAKAIAMRLMHGGKKVYVVGETTTPAIESGDVLLMLSGSGKTHQTLHIGKSASECGAYVFLVTTNKEAMDSPWCSAGLCIPAATKCKMHEKSATIQPLGNQFDQSAHIILDAAIINALNSKIQQDMKRNHTNLE